MKASITILGMSVALLSLYLFGFPVPATTQPPLETSIVINTGLVNLTVSGPAIAVEQKDPVGNVLRAIVICTEKPTVMGDTITCDNVTVHCEGNPIEVRTITITCGEHTVFDLS